MEIICGDSLEKMRDFEDDAFDLVLTDPPYGIGEDERDADSSGRLAWKAENRWDLSIPSKEYFDEMFRVSKNQIIWGGNYFVENGLKNSRGWLSWDKMQRFTGADMELAWTSFEKSAKTFRLSRVEFHGRENKHHPTMKPLELMKWCLAFAGEIETVLDPFMGSGTTLVAAQQFGLEATGIEINPAYCEIARERLSQKQLF